MVCRICTKYPEKIDDQSQGSARGVLARSIRSFVDFNRLADSPASWLAFKMADGKVTTSLLRSITFSLVASLQLMAQASTARADHASCMEKAKSYFSEIGQLLSKEKNWIMPFVELNERYSPLEDCDTDLLLQEATQWRYIQPIIYNPYAKAYLVRFWSDDVTVEFAYDSRKKKSRAHSAGWVNK